MFVRIYLGLLTTILLSLLLSYFVFSLVNEVRETRYNESIYQGTFELIRGGLQRQEGEKRDEWLAIVKRLSGIELVLKPYSSLDDKQASSRLRSGELLFNEQDEIEGQDRYIARLPIDENTYLEANLESASEQQLRVALLLALNKLQGLSEKASVVDEVNRLQNYFPFPLSIAQVDQVDLDSTQIRRLKTGAIIVVLSTDEDDTESQSVYALIDRKANQLLVLGPIPIYTNTPIALVIVLVFLNILIVGIAAYVMVRRLEKRLNTMSELVNQFGPQNLQPRLSDEGKGDSVSALADNFNSMAERIAELIEDQKHMSQAISHELRTPIARMKFRLDILGSQFEGSDEQSVASLEKIEGLKRDLTELNNLVDEALFFQQVDSLAHMVESSYETLLLRPCVEELRQKLLAINPDKTLEIDFEGEIPVRVNPNYLRRLLQNLILNGLRHAESRVKVAYLEDKERHCLIVEDDGEGIEEELRELLFQPFQRAENSRNKKLGGYGLGLAIVRRIAELHQGEVSVDKSALGGARFRFTWPKEL